MIYGVTYTWYGIPQSEVPTGGTEVVAHDGMGNVYGPVTSHPQTAQYELPLPAGTYTVIATVWGYQETMTGVSVAEGESLALDILILMDDVDAPYIYLYPETTQAVDVTLLPAPGTYVHTSFPAYNGGWSVTAEPSGLLDGQYDFLYYEATVHWVFQTTEGWAVADADVFDWFEGQLPALGLTAAETEDFLDFWSIHLPPAPCYLIYPQPEADIDQTMGLVISPAPDSLLRLWLVVQGSATCTPLPAPATSPFVRDGFTAVEWGVVLDAETF